MNKENKNVPCIIHNFSKKPNCPESLFLMKLYLNEFPKDINALDINNNTPLLLACEYASNKIGVEFIKTLLNRGADPNIKNSNGHTPLIIVCCKPNLHRSDLYQLFAEYKANFDIKNKYGIYPLFSYMFEILVNESYFFNKEIFDLILEKTNDINQGEIHNVTPLILASQFSKNENAMYMVNSLLNKGANVNIKDNYGYTPLFVACSKLNTTSSKICIETLIEHGADPNMTSFKGFTPLMFLCIIPYNDDKTDVIRYLLK